MVTIENWICKVAEANNISPESIRRKIKDTDKHKNEKKKDRREGEKNGVR